MNEDKQASTEPMYLISESELNKLFRFKELKNGNVRIWTGSTGTADDTLKSVELVKQIRARGPVAQQAPAVISGIGFTKKAFLKFLQWYGIAFDEKEDGIYIRIPGDSMYLKFDKIYREHSPERDAALIAQEREKWEQEHTKKPGCYNSCPFDDLCANDIEKIQVIERMAAAQAREDVLKEAITELNTLYKNYSEDRHQSAEYTDGAQTALDLMEQRLESLRPGQKQERDPE